MSMDPNSPYIREMIIEEQRRRERKGPLFMQPFEDAEEEEEPLPDVYCENCQSELVDSEGDWCDDCLDWGDEEEEDIEDEE